MLYTIVILGIILIVTLGVYATVTPGTAPNPGHLLSDISPPTECTAGQYVSWNGDSLICSDYSSPSISSVGVQMVSATTSSTSCSVSCPSGKIVLGGTCSSNSGIIQKTLPSENTGWTCVTSANYCSVTATCANLLALPVNVILSSNTYQGNFGNSYCSSRYGSNWNICSSTQLSSGNYNTCYREDYGKCTDGTTAWVDSYRSSPGFGDCAGGTVYSPTPPWANNTKRAGGQDHWNSATSTWSQDGSLVGNEPFTYYVVYCSGYNSVACCKS
ncbi:Uncharacterised protein [uncultured archaeon]|nr:Uncharacterised protein [uncultured archaeon]